MKTLHVDWLLVLSNVLDKEVKLEFVVLLKYKSCFETGSSNISGRFCDRLVVYLGLATADEKSFEASVTRVVIVGEQVHFGLKVL